MTNDEAKFILNAYRPNGRDATDSTFGAALEQAKRDPSLGAWFAREQAHASAISAKLREVAPPAGLRDAILAGSRASGAAPTAKRAWIAWVGAAAALLVLGISITLWRSPRNESVDTLTKFALDDTAHARHGGHGPATTALQLQLSQPTTHLASGLPVDFASLKTTGCRSLTVAGHDVLEVCFGRNGAEFHCYIARKDDFPAGTGPGVVQQGSFGSASWSDAAYRFVVVSTAGAEAVKRLL
jgi:anti-sigma factor RsiW